MPEQFPNPFTCGTESPIWINGTHPNIENSTKEVSGCVRDSNTCTQTFPIQIKKCSGFYAYNLPYVDLCFRGYCFGNHTCEEKTTTSISAGPEPSTTTTTIPSSDPCLYAATLSNMDKRGSQCSLKDVDYALCDRTLKPGWYKAIDDNVFHNMPTYCVTVASCGTEEPIWLNGSLPKFTDGAVLRKACVRGFDPGDCCKNVIDIYIRNCFTYNVYYLPYTDLCYSAYCFGNRECKKKTDDNLIIEADKTSDSLLFILLGSFGGVMLVTLVVVVIVVKTKSLRIGHSRVDLQNTPPPPYSPPTHGKPAVTVGSTSGNIPLKS
ncbi:Hypothetical predicted protein [Mytilus galloprovincialis]|nr:Hypothetical predicted protein [Mytilus galloprovincialis]